MHLNTCNEKDVQMKTFRSVVHTSLMTYLFYTLMTKYKIIFILICNVQWKNYWHQILIFLPEIQYDIT